MRGRWSLRSRLTGLVLVTTGAVLVVLAVLLYVVVRRTAWQQHDAALIARAHALAVIAEREDQGYEMPLPPDAVGEPTSYIEVWTREGVVVARSASLHGGDLSRANIGDAGATFSDSVLPDGRDGRMVGIRFLPRDVMGTDPAAPLTLVLAEGTETIDVAISTVRGWFLVLGVAALLAIALITTWSLSRGLRPLTTLASRIEQIDDRRLATRVPSDGQPIELEAPIRKLNDLLGRLDESFARERQFTADVSHELRTPLAGLRTLLEVTALTERPTAEYAEVLGRALVGVKQLCALVENLIALVRLDGGQLELAPDEVVLRLLVDECWKPYAAVAAARGLAFSNSVAGEATVRTDREKLRIVITNLLANAAEYTEAGGWIDVTTVAGGVIEVVDSGPPIPDDQLERVFDRLWRGDAGRSATGVHCGIGLSLARALCDRLSLSLTVTSAPERVSFRIT